MGKKDKKGEKNKKHDKPSKKKADKKSKKKHEASAKEGFCPCCSKHCPLTKPKCSKGKKLAAKLLSH